MGDNREHDDLAEGPLIDPASDEVLGDPTAPSVIVPRRKIIIEPLLVLFALITFPLVILTQKFVVDKITKMKHFNESNSNSTDNYCDMNQSSLAFKQQQEIQSEAAEFNIYSTLCNSIPSLFTTVFLGSLSDKLGRKFAMLPPLVGLFILTLSYVLVIFLDLPIWYLLIGRVLEGLCGSYLALLMGCLAYIADITKPEDRQFRITVVELIMFLSGILGPIGVGVWIQEMGYLPPLLLILAGNILNILYVIFLVPETVVRQSRVKICDISYLLKSGLLFVKDDGSNRRGKLIMLISSFFVVGTVQLSSGVDTLFQMNSPLCWGTAMIGYYTATYVGVGASVGLLLAKLLKYCLSDNILALVTCMDGILKYVYIGFVANTVMMFCGVAFAPLSALYFPTMRAIMSKLVAPLEQGSMFGAIAFVEVLCSLIGTVSLSSIYSATLHIHTGFVYFYAAIVYTVGTAVLLAYVIMDYRKGGRECLVNDDQDDED